jgi:hypothetical protein
MMLSIGTIIDIRERPPARDWIDSGSSKRVEAFTITRRRMTGFGSIGIILHQCLENISSYCELFWYLNKGRQMAVGRNL